MVASGDRASLRRSLVFATDVLEPLIPLARAAEQAGFHRVWTTEFQGRDAIVRALGIGLHTRRIGIGTGIAYAFTRPSLAMAPQALDVQRLLGGRFSLGLGTGTRGVRRWYDATFEPAATRYAAYVDELRDVWADICPPPPLAAPPVYGAGLNPAMLRAVARSSEGAVLHPLAMSRRHLHEAVLPAIAAGRARAAPSVAGSSCRIAMWCIASIDSDEELARSRVRRQLAFYLSTPSYKSVLEGTPWPAVADAVQAKFAATRPNIVWRDFEPLIPDALVDELALSGTPLGVAERAARLEVEMAAAGVDELVFQTVGTDLTPDETVDNCRSIVSSLRPVVNPA